ncbi:hypothetical protein D3C87_1970420 [compost metagenome]
MLVKIAISDIMEAFELGLIEHFPERPATYLTPESQSERQRCGLPLAASERRQRARKETTPLPRAKIPGNI